MKTSCIAAASLRQLFPWVLLFMLYACGSYPPAPVVDRSVSVSGGKPGAEVRAGYHTVKKGDTLYSIALDHGQDYKDVAAWNNLENPNVIRIGQQLRVSPGDGGAPVAVAKPVSATVPVEVRPAGAASKEASKEAPKDTGSELVKREPRGGKVRYSDEALAGARRTEMATVSTPAVEPVAPAVSDVKPKPAEKVAAADDVSWNWPANGKLLKGFADGSSKGLDIGGKAGDPVFAAASGVVSYSGSGLRGYGNLVVLRHNASYLSVYAHNSKILVKEKQTVTQGQKIAEIGSSDAESPRLHFEIRHQGKPVDPQKFLPVR